MKPQCPFSTGKKFPMTDYFFHAGMGEWRGYSSPSDDENSERRKFHNLSRQFLIESAQERSREMAMFAVVVAVSAWPVIYMVISVIQLLLKGRPLDS